MSRGPEARREAPEADVVAEACAAEAGAGERRARWIAQTRPEPRARPATSGRSEAALFMEREEGGGAGDEQGGAENTAPPREST